MILFTMKEAAQKLGVSYATLSSQLFVGNIPAPQHRAGAAKLWTEDEVDAAQKFFAERDARRKVAKCG